jgi:hypothetical protein
MRQEDRDNLLAFEAAVAAIPNVVQAQRLSSATVPCRRRRADRPREPVRLDRSVPILIA